MLYCVYSIYYMIYMIYRCDACNINKGNSVGNESFIYCFTSFKPFKWSF